MDMFSAWGSHFSSPWLRLVISLLAGLLLGLVISIVLRGVESRTRRPIISESLRSVRPVVLFASVLIGLRAGINAFQVQPDLAHQIGNAFSFALVLLGTWAINRVYDIFHEHALEPFVSKGNQAIDTSLLKVVRTIAHALLWVLGIGSGLSSAGYDITAILAGLGIGGLALALAAQDTVANLFGGAIVLTQAPFKVGDKIKVKDIEGWVIDIGLRATTITDWYGRIIVLPNRAFTDNPVTNVDARPHYWKEVRLKLRYDTTVEQIRQAITIVRECAKSSEHLLAKHWVGLAHIGEGFFEIEVWVGIKKYNSKDPFANEYDKISRVQSDFLLGILETLAKNGIHLATPIETRFVNPEGARTDHF